MTAQMGQESWPGVASRKAGRGNDEASPFPKGGVDKALWQQRRHCHRTNDVCFEGKV